MPTPGTLISHLLATAERAPGRPAIELPDREVSYGELAALVAGQVAVLRHSGVRSGDMVAVEVANDLATACTLLALAAMGATALLPNTRLSPEALARQVAEAGARLLAPALAAPATPPLEWPAGGSQAPQTLLFTSGSTARPKGVLLGWEQHLASARAVNARLGVGAADRWFLCLPLYHVGGLAILHRMILVGGTVLLWPGFDEGAVRTALEARVPTLASLTPTMLARLLAGGWVVPDHVRTVLLGGERTPEALLVACPQAVASYGMSETASTLATTRDLALGFEPLPGVRVAIADADGRELPPGEGGHIRVLAGSVMRGYLGEPAGIPGVLDTADLGVGLPDGRFSVRDRPTELILSGGENLSPAEIEEALAQDPGIRAAAVVGLPDAYWGMVAAAAIVPNPDRFSGPEALARGVAELLGRYKVPRRFAVVDALPLLPSGKVDREAVRSLFSNGAG